MTTRPIATAPITVGSTPALRAARASDPAHFDLSDLAFCDMSGAALVVAATRGAEIAEATTGASPAVEALLIRARTAANMADPSKAAPRSRPPAGNPLTNQKVRQAIWHAINRQEIADTDGPCPAKFFSFLKMWLASHICGIDAKYGAVAAESVDRAEDRERFKQAMLSIGLDVPKGFTLKGQLRQKKDSSGNPIYDGNNAPVMELGPETLSRALTVLDEVGLPAVIRPSFTMGGTGGGIAYNREEFFAIVEGGLEASPTNEVLIEANEWGGHLAAMASEEMDGIYLVPNRYPQGEYLLLFDPLDGSSNIDVNVSIGTIFSVLKKPEGTEGVSEKDFLQPGRKQVAAGYCVYGPQTTLVLTVGDGVAMFTLDREQGSFVLTQESVQIPADTKEFAINMSNMRHWDEPVKRYIDECLQGKEGPRGKDFNMRWIASMVADVHRILTRGGIFMYPRDLKDLSKPGKLRLMYEANPMLFIVEQAGGAATNARTRILDLQPSKLHERVSVVLGSKNEVDRVTAYHQQP